MRLGSLKTISCCGSSTLPDDTHRQTRFNSASEFGKFQQATNCKMLPFVTDTISYNPTNEGGNGKEDIPFEHLAFLTRSNENQMNNSDVLGSPKIQLDCSNMERHQMTRSIILRYATIKEEDEYASENDSQIE